MSGVIVLTVAGVWLLLGQLVWRWLIKSYLIGKPFYSYAKAIFLAIWLIGPVFDEIVGSYQFDKACKEHQGYIFNGPVSVGAGRFYDDTGNPHWKNNEDLEKIPIAEWWGIFNRSETRSIIRSKIMLIIEVRIVYKHQPSGVEILTVREIISPGGWLRKSSGWGSHSPYTCDMSIYYPPRSNWIKF